MIDVVVFFFLLGVLARLVKSDLRLPEALYETLSIYLLLAIGLKGGIELSKQPVEALAPQVLACMALGACIPLLLYPLALISAAGVLLLLTLAYSMVWVMLFHRENTYQNAHQLLLPLAGGFGLALAQIILLDLARYVLTGTWDGFHLG